MTILVFFNFFAPDKLNFCMWHLFQLKNIARYFFRCVSLRFLEITFANNNALHVLKKQNV